MGDPTVTGWLITVAYVLTALRCFRTAKALAGTSDPSRVRPWWWIGAFVGTLGINKQLDLQTLLIEWGRTGSRVLGLYESRRGIEIAFLVLLCLACIVFVGLWISHFRVFLRERRVLASGILITSLYVGIRAADTLHALPATFAMDESAPVCLFELAGISIMFCGARA